jgi:phosphoenolpyruvate carboxylase
MVRFREGERPEGREEALDRAASLLARLAPQDLSDVARAYTLYLQLVNVCENAYRTHRLRDTHDERHGERSRDSPVSEGSHPGRGRAGARITFVLTAHPTESRSPANIRLLRRVQDHVLASLEASREIDRREIRNLIQLAWRVGTHPRRKPTVDDEAAHLFSLLTDPILSEWIALTEAGHEVLLRSWVGGDKDGHPGVGPDQTHASLQRSRDRLLAFVEGVLLPPVVEDSRLAAEALAGTGSPVGASAPRKAGTPHRSGPPRTSGPPREADRPGEPGAADRPGEPGAADRPGEPGAADIETALAGLGVSLRALDRVSRGDGARVAALRASIDTFQALWRELQGIAHPAIQRLSTLLGVFPALVVPLELREERGHFGPETPIAGMMARLSEIGRGGSVEHYARAVVVSMTLEAEDLLDGQRLVDAVLGGDASDRPGNASKPDGNASAAGGTTPDPPGVASDPDGAGSVPACVPVIPLFELPDVLERAPDILAETWKDERFREAVRKRGHLEVMLGYSDTAKRMGMLASRVALHDAMRRIGEWAESEAIDPLFFHGHGGSVGRGGGRIEDLAATWPPTARTPYKYTVQGEMVERTFASPAILRSLVEKVARVQHDPPAYRGVSDLTRELARRSQEAFERRVASDSFRELLAAATPYTRLEALTIGSRPTSRGEGGLEKLRAIPWVLCWTQTRLLLPAWLGVGQAWREIRERPDIEEALADARANDPLFRSYSRLLSFTMAKTEPRIWRRYRRRLAGSFPEDDAAEVEAAEVEVAEGEVAELDADYEAAIDLACRAVGGDSLLPDRPWLEESIRYRAPMIHPLNLIQIDLLERPEWSEEEVRLFRETVTGIAAGMLTTG